MSVLDNSIVAGSLGGPSKIAEIPAYFRSRKIPVLANPSFLFEPCVQAIKPESVMSGAFFEHLFEKGDIRWEKPGMTEIGWWYNRLFFLPVLVSDDTMLTNEVVCEGWRLWKHWHKQAGAPPAALSHEFSDFVAWRELEVALRIQCMCYFFDRVRNHPSTSDEDIILMTNSLAEHGKFLLRHYENFGHFSGNHQEHHGPALFILGTYLPELKWAKQFQKTGLEILTWHLKNDYYQDGWQKETTPGYQLICIRNYSDTIRNAQLNGVTIPKEIGVLFPKMLAAAASMLAGDGSCAAFNDANHFSEMEHIKSIADLHQIALGDLPQKESKLFPEAQIAVIRSGENTHLFIDATRAASGHWHPGKPNFEWFAQDRWMIIDAGVATYDGPDYLKWYKAADNHNTMTVDGLGDAEFRNTWQYKWSATPKIISWQPPKSISIKTDGYEGREKPAQWTRTFIIPNTDELKIIDEIQSSGQHCYGFHFHVAPDMEIIKENNARFVVLDKEQRGFMLRYHTSDFSLKQASIYPVKASWGPPVPYHPFSPYRNTSKMFIEFYGKSGEIKWELIVLSATKYQKAK